MKRIIFIVIFLALLVVIVLCIFKCQSGRGELNVFIVMLESPDSSQKDMIVETVVSAIGNKKRDVNMHIFDSQKWSVPVSLKKPSGITKADTWKKSLTDSVEMVLRQTSVHVLTDEQANRCLETLALKISEQNQKEDQSIIVLTGLFPTCYKKSSADSASHVVDKILKTDANIGSNVQVLWYPEKDANNYQKIVYDVFTKSTKFSDNSILTSKVCKSYRVNPRDDSSLVSFEVLALSRLDSLDAQDWAMKIASEISSKGKSLFLSSMASNALFDELDSTAVYNTLFYQFTHTQDADWNSAKYAFNQTFTRISDERGSHHIYLIGTLPYKEDTLLEPDLLKNLDSTYFSIKIRSKEKGRGTAIQKALINALRYHNPNIQFTAY